MIRIRATGPTAQIMSTRAALAAPLGLPHR